MPLWDDSLNKTVPQIHKQLFAKVMRGELSEMQAIVKTLFEEPTMSHTNQTKPTNATEFYAWVKQNHPNERALVQSFIDATMKALNTPTASLLKEFEITKVLNQIATNAGITPTQTKELLTKNGFKFRENFDQRDGGIWLQLQ